MAYENSRFDRGERGGQGRARGRRDDYGSFDSGRNQNKRHPFVSDNWGEEQPQERAPRRFDDRDDRRGGFDRDDRGERRFGGRDDRRGGFNRDDRGERRFGGRDDRRGGFNRDDRGERRFGGRDDRRGGFDRDDRGERRFGGRDDRRGGFDRDDRGERRFGGRDDRRGGFNRDDRGERRFGGRDDRRGGFNRDDRGERRFGGRDDRRGGFNRDDRGERRFGGRDDRRGGFGRDERGGRRFGNRDSFRPRRQETGDQERHAENVSKKEAGYIRLNRYIANAGVCSRREADTMIESGSVLVNGVVCTVLGTLVGPDDKVQLGEQTLSAEKKVYLLLNKPKGYITTSEDPEERKTVMELVDGACRERIYPVGRLDRNTTGVLLFTNDGDMAKNLTHPSHGARKIYHVTLNEPLSKADFSAIAKGVMLEDGLTEVDEISYVDEDNRREVGIQLHSGKNRIVRRIFEHFGYEVAKLDRVLFAELTKKDLRRGQWRFLTEQEISFLKMNAGRKATEKKSEGKSSKKAVFTPEQLEEAEYLAKAEEAPVKKRATRKKTEESEPAGEAPVKKRATRKKTEESEPAGEAPVKKRATRKKTEESEPAGEVPVKKRATRKKSEK